MPTLVKFSKIHGPLFVFQISEYFNDFLLLYFMIWCNNTVKISFIY